MHPKDSGAAALIFDRLCRRKSHRYEHRSAVLARGGRVVRCLARACVRQKNRELNRMAH